MAAMQDDFEAFVHSAAALVGIPVAAEWRQGVAAHLAIIMANAELVVA